MAPKKIFTTYEITYAKMLLYSFQGNTKSLAERGFKILMALQDLLNLTKPKKKIGLSEERVRAQIPTFTKWVSFWREYP